MTDEEFAAALDRTLERWQPDSVDLSELEALVRQDELAHGEQTGVFSKGGRDAIREAIARRRAA